MRDCLPRVAVRAGPVSNSLSLLVGFLLRLSAPIGYIGSVGCPAAPAADSSDTGPICPGSAAWPALDRPISRQQALRPPRPLSLTRS